MNTEPIIFVEESRSEAHPIMEFVAVQVKSGTQIINMCFPLALAKQFLENLDAEVTKAIKLKKKRDDNVETSSRTPDPSPSS